MESPQELKDLNKEELISIILELKRRLLAYENAHTPLLSRENILKERNPEEE